MKNRYNNQNGTNAVESICPQDTVAFVVATVVSVIEDFDDYVDAVTEKKKQTNVTYQLPTPTCSST